MFVFCFFYYLSFSSFLAFFQTLRYLGMSSSLFMCECIFYFYNLYLDKLFTINCFLFLDSRAGKQNALIFERFGHLKVNKVHGSSAKNSLKSLKIQIPTDMAIFTPSTIKNGFHYKTQKMVIWLTESLTICCVYKSE